MLVLLGLLTIAGSALLVRHYPVLTMLATPVILIAILIPLNAKLPWWVEKDPR